MQDRADFGMRLLSDHERRFGPPAGAVQAHLLHGLNQPSRVAASRGTFATPGNHAPERMAIGTVWIPVVES